MIDHIRNKLIEYFERIINLLYLEEKQIELGLETEIDKYCSKNIVSNSEWFPKRIGVVDGGSNVIALNIGYIGVVSAIGIIIENNNVVERVISKPEIVPADPGEISLFENIDLIESIVDKMREALVFETSRKLISRDIDLLVIDGPLIPYGALAKIVTGSPSEYFAWERYRNSVLNLHSVSVSGKTSLIGFVKRPRSRYLTRAKSFDHVMLSKYLEKPGEYCPDPPVSIDLKYIHEESVRKIIEAIEPKFTYMRLTNSTPPLRIDFGYLDTDYRNILSYIYSTRTREGIPYVIMKADEEAKITRKLMRELYDDALHHCIFKYFRIDSSRIIPLLPEYGW